MESFPLNLEKQQFSVEQFWRNLGLPEDWLRLPPSSYYRTLLPSQTWPHWQEQSYFSHSHIITEEVNRLYAGLMQRADNLQERELATELSTIEAVLRYAFDVFRKGTGYHYGRMCNYTTEAHESASSLVMRPCPTFAGKPLNPLPYHNPFTGSTLLSLALDRPVADLDLSEQPAYIRTARSVLLLER